MSVLTRFFKALFLGFGLWIRGHQTLPFKTYMFLLNHYPLFGQSGLFARIAQASDATLTHLRQGSEHLHILHLGETAGIKWADLKEQLSNFAELFTDKPLQQWIAKDLGYGSTDARISKADITKMNDTVKKLLQQKNVRMWLDQTMHIGQENARITWKQLQNAGPHTQLILLDQELRSWVSEALHLGQEGGITFENLERLTNKNTLKSLQEKSVSTWLLHHQDDDSTWTQLAKISPEAMNHLINNPSIHSLLLEKGQLGQPSGIAWKDLNNLTSFPGKSIFIDARIDFARWLLEACHLGQVNGTSWTQLEQLPYKDFNRTLNTLSNSPSTRTALTELLHLGQQDGIHFEQIDQIIHEIGTLSALFVDATNSKYKWIQDKTSGYQKLAKAVFIDNQNPTIWRGFQELNQDKLDWLSQDNRYHLIAKYFKLGQPGGISWNDFNRIGNQTMNLFADETICAYVRDELQLLEQDGLRWEDVLTFSNLQRSLLQNKDARKIMATVSPDVIYDLWVPRWDQIHTHRAINDAPVRQWLMDHLQLGQENGLTITMMLNDANRSEALLSALLDQKVRKWLSGNFDCKTGTSLQTWKRLVSLSKGTFGIIKDPVECDKIAHAFQFGK